MLAGSAGHVIFILSEEEFMKKGKQIFLFFVSLCIVLAACRGRNSKSSNLQSTAEELSSTTTLSFDEHVEVEYMGWSNNKLDGTDSIFREIEKRFNMKLTYTSVPNNEYQNFSTMRIASGDIPELFKTMVPNDEGLNVYRGLQLDGVLVNITPYMNKFSFSNLEKILQDPSIMLMRENDGFYMVPNYLGPSTTALYVRQDWVDSLGLARPKTTDEFREFLRAIVKADPDRAQTTGLTVAGLGGLENFISLFTGNTGNWVKHEGQWVHKVMQPKFKEAIEFSAGLYKEGLLDPEFVMLNITNIQEKISSGKAATLFLNGTAAWFNPMQNAMTAYKQGARLSAIVPWPEGPGGPIKPAGTPFFGAVHINTGATEAQILRILSFLDWQFTDECLDLYYYGIEGEHYTMVDGKKVVNDKAKQAITFGRDLYLFYDIINNFSQYNYLTIEPLIKNLEWTRQAAVTQEVIGLSTEVTIEIAPRLNEVYTRWIVDFITGARNIDAQWDTFIAEFKAAGYDKYQQEVVKYMEDK
jgi:putative aldouronate transport system substrate-binding protein